MSEEVTIHEGLRELCAAAEELSDPRPAITVRHGPCPLPKHRQLLGLSEEGAGEGPNGWLPGMNLCLAKMGEATSHCSEILPCS